MIPNMIKERCDDTNNDVIGILSFTGDFGDDFVLSNPSVNDLFYNTLPLVFKVLFTRYRYSHGNTAHLCEKMNVPGFYKPRFSMEA